MSLPPPRANDDTDGKVVHQTLALLVHQSTTHITCRQASRLAGCSCPASQLILTSQHQSAHCTGQHRGGRVTGVPHRQLPVRHLPQDLTVPRAGVLHTGALLQMVKPRHEAVREVPLEPSTAGGGCEVICAQATPAGFSKPLPALNLALPQNSLPHHRRALRYTQGFCSLHLRDGPGLSAVIASSGHDLGD